MSNCALVSPAGVGTCLARWMPELVGAEHAYTHTHARPATIQHDHHRRSFSSVSHLCACNNKPSYQTIITIITATLRCVVKQKRERVPDNRHCDHNQKPLQQHRRDGRHRPRRPRQQVQKISQVCLFGKFYFYFQMSKHFYCQPRQPPKFASLFRQHGHISFGKKK